MPFPTITEKIGWACGGFAPDRDLKFGTPVVPPIFLPLEKELEAWEEPGWFESLGITPEMMSPYGATGGATDS